MVTFRDVRKLIVRFYFERVRPCGDDLGCVFDSVEALYERLRELGVVPLREPDSSDDNCCDVLKKVRYREEYYIEVFGIKWDAEFCCVYDVNLLFRGIVDDTAFAPNSFMHIAAEHHRAEYYSDYIRYMFRYRRFYRFVVLLYYRMMWSGEVVSEEELRDVESQTDVVRLMWPIVRRGVSSLSELRIVAGSIDNYFVVLNDGTIIENERWVDDIFGYSYTYSMPGLYLLSYGDEQLFWKVSDAVYVARKQASEWFHKWYDYQCYLRFKARHPDLDKYDWWTLENIWMRESGEICREVEQMEDEMLKKAFEIMNRAFRRELEKLIKA